MKIYNLLVLLSFVVIATGCKKVNITTQKLQGNYTGQLVSKSDQPSVTNFNVQLSGNTYQASATSGVLPLGTKGSFKVNNNQVVFVDSLAHTANFNWGLLLNGSYATQLKGDSLILIKSDGSYAYRLKKQ
jgi:hypothetical protein